jgi:hypothetical protein
LQADRYEDDGNDNALHDDLLERLIGR